MNLTDLKLAMEAAVNQMDHRNLDIDVPFFKSVPSTTGALTAPLLGVEVFN